MATLNQHLAQRGLAPVVRGVQRVAQHLRGPAHISQTSLAPPAPAIEWTGHHNSASREKGMNFASCARAIASSQFLTSTGLHQSPSQWAFKTYGQDHVVTKMLGQQEKNFLAAGDARLGGLQIPPPVAEEMYALLREREVFENVVRPQHRPIINGKLSLPSIKNGTTVSWIGEGGTIPTTGMEFDLREVSVRKAAAIVPMTWEIATSGVAMDATVRNDLLKALQEAFEIAKIFGTGANGQPRGARNWANFGGLFIPAAADPTLANFRTDLSKMLQALRSRKKGNVTSAALLGGPALEEYLVTVTDPQNGRTPFKDEVEKGMLRQRRFGTSGHFPEDLGPEGNASELLLIDGDDCIVGDVSETRVDVTKEATLISGNTQLNAFQQDMQFMRIIAFTAFAMRYDSIVVLTNHKYGEQFVN